MKKGLTLIEVLIYSMLMIFILTGIYSVFTASMQNYHLISSTIDVQKASLNTVHRLAKELSESKLSYIKLYGTDPKGIVFLSPRNNNGVFQYYMNASDSNDSNNQKPMWQKYVVYYVDTDPEDSSSKAIIRKTEMLTTPSVSPTFNPQSISYYQSLSGTSIPKNVLAHKVYSATFYWLNSGTVTYSIPTESPIYVTISALDIRNGVSKQNTFSATTALIVKNK